MGWKKIGDKFSSELSVGVTIEENLRRGFFFFRTASIANYAISKSRLKTSNGVYLRVAEDLSTVSTTIF